MSKETEKRTKVTQEFIDDAADTCEKALAKIIAQQNRIDTLEKALGEQKRRTLHLRSELTGRIAGDAAKKFFAVTEGNIGLIDAALHPSENEVK